MNANRGGNQGQHAGPHKIWNEWKMMHDVKLSGFENFLYDECWEKLSSETQSTYKKVMENLAIQDLPLLHPMNDGHKHRTRTLHGHEIQQILTKSDMEIQHNYVCIYAHVYI